MDSFIAGPVIQIFNQTWHRLSLREAFKIYTFFSNKVPRCSLRVCYSVMVHRTFENNEPLFRKHNLDCEDSTFYS